MRKLLKFGHSMTAITFLGSVVVLWVFHHYLPPPAEALEIYVAERQVMERVATLENFHRILVFPRFHHLVETKHGRLVVQLS